MGGIRVQDGGMLWQRCKASRRAANLSGGFTVCCFPIWVAFSAYCARRMAWEGGETEHCWTVYIEQRGNYRHEVIY